MEQSTGCREGVRKVGVIYAETEKTLIFNMLQQTYVDMTMLSALDFGLGRSMAL